MKHDISNILTDEGVTHLTNEFVLPLIKELKKMEIDGFVEIDGYIYNSEQCVTLLKHVFKVDTTTEFKEAAQDEDKQQIN